jgi:alpha-beta hydrolase superfamily lysophospholipase
MATQVLYRPERIGDWGTPVPVAGGAYGTDTLKLRDGTDIFFRYWRAVDPAAPVLVLLHGLGAHSGWFIDMGNQLNTLGLTVFIDDHRGFGRSGGPRGHVKRGRIYLSDITAYLDEVQRRRPGAPLFVLGHSMGGIFATYLAAADARTGRNRIKGLILANPWIKDVVAVKPGAVLRAVFNGALGSSKLFMLPPNISGMTLNAEAAGLLDADSFWVRNQSYAFLYQISRMRMGILKQAAAVKAPALVIQGEKDMTLSQPATRTCYEALGSADKTWKTYPDFAHDFEFEPGRGVLDADLADWIMRHRA